MSIVSVIEPEVEESVMAAQVVISVPVSSSTVMVLAPHRSLRGDEAVSTASPGITKSDVAVEPSVTAIEDGLKVAYETLVVGHGFTTVKV